MWRIVREIFAKYFTEVMRYIIRMCADFSTGINIRFDMIGFGKAHYSKNPCNVLMIRVKEDENTEDITLKID